MRIDGIVTEISPDREIKAILKAKRAEIRLKYSLLADQEIADTLPELEKRLLAALEAGERPEISVGVGE